MRIDRLLGFVAERLRVRGYLVTLTLGPGASVNDLLAAPWHGMPAAGVMDSLYGVANGWSIVVEADAAHAQTPLAFWEAEMAPLHDLRQLHDRRQRYLTEESNFIADLTYRRPDLHPKIQQMPFLVRIYESSTRYALAVDVRDEKASVYTCDEYWWYNEGTIEGHGRLLATGLRDFLLNWASYEFREPLPTRWNVAAGPQGIVWTQAFKADKDRLDMHTLRHLMDDLPSDSC